MERYSVDCRFQPVNIRTADVPGVVRTRSEDARCNLNETTQLRAYLFTYPAIAAASYSSKRPFGQKTRASTVSGANQNPNVSYDQAGNQTSLGPLTLIYDAENRQTSAYNTVTSGSETFAYDGLGQRVMKSLGAQTTVYVYDAFGQLAAEY